MIEIWSRFYFGLFFYCCFFVILYFIVCFSKIFFLKNYNGIVFLCLDFKIKLLKGLFLDFVYILGNVII